MAQMLYTDEHEWLRVEGEVVTVGITDHAQEQLGEIVFVDLPEIGRVVAQKDELAVVESVKAASDVYAPVSGEVLAINDLLGDAPRKVNDSPEGEGWFCQLKLSKADELEDLMDLDAYQSYLATLG
jgi:glycine cleavage system H protein